MLILLRLRWREECWLWIDQDISHLYIDSLACCTVIYVVEIKIDDTYITIFPFTYTNRYVSS
jgi:hypothetical protein